MNATYAMEQSINTAFIDMSASIPDGPDKILKTANQLGIPPADRDPDFPGIPESSGEDLEADSRITLGKARLSPINMANAYATIAAEGQRADVHVIEKVKNSAGETLYNFKQPDRPGVSKDVAADTSYAMQQVVQNGTGQAALGLSPYHAAGKTGTATNDKDQVSSAWFVGYTPQLSTAVMYVRGDGDDQLDGWLPSYFGADYPADTWTAIMRRDMEGLEVEYFPPPANLDGDAPEDGHAPYTPPPTPTKKPSPTKTTKTPDEPTPTARRRTTPPPAADADRLVQPARLPDRPRTPVARPHAHRQPDGGGVAAAAASGPGTRRRSGSGRGDHPARWRRPARVRDRVHPTLDDPVVTALSESVGGPVGQRVGRHPWWTPVRVVLALTALCFALGMVQKASCYDHTWQNGDAVYSHLCYSDLPYLYTGRGFVELNWPFTDDAQVRDRYDVMEYPVVISYYAWGAAWVTHWLNGSPDISPRYAQGVGGLSSDPEVSKEIRYFVIVNAVGFAVAALLAAWLLSGVNPRRPWDAALFALSPALALSALVNWDMLAVVLVAGALWAWARDRPVLTGVLIGLGTATKLFPLFLLGGVLVICLRNRRVRDFALTAGAAVAAWVLANLPAYLTGPEQWRVFWHFNADRGRRPRLDLAGRGAGEGHRDPGAHDQRGLLGLLRGLVPRGPRAGHAGARDPAAGAARLPGGRRLPAGEQGLLAPVRPLAAAARRDRAPALARPAGLAGR